MSEQFEQRDHARHENESGSVDVDGQYKDNESYSQASQGYP